MKLLMINGSPKQNGNTARVLSEMRQIFEDASIEVEVFDIGTAPIQGCTGCSACFKVKHCVIEDRIVELAQKFEECDGMVIGSPVYYAAPNGSLIALLDRLFYSTRFDKRMKVGASVVVARRGGCSAAFDQLNKYFTISGMPIASSQYWNSVHGAIPHQVEADEEGMQTVRTLARNMIFLMKSIELGKEAYGLPEQEKFLRTNFIR